MRAFCVHVTDWGPNTSPWFFCPWNVLVSLDWHFTNLLLLSRTVVLKHFVFVVRQTVDSIWLLSELLKLSGKNTVWKCMFLNHLWSAVWRSRSTTDGCWAIHQPSAHSSTRIKRRLCSQQSSHWTIIKKNTTSILHCVNPCISMRTHQDVRRLYIVIDMQLMFCTSCLKETYE